jgi:uncharacterized Fe-S center protein
MTRRRFVAIGSTAAAAALAQGLAGCSDPADDVQSVQGASGDDQGATDVSTNADSGSAGASTVFFTHTVDADALESVFAALGEGLGDGRIGVKLSTGESGSNYLRADLISGLVKSLNATIVECNTAYDGPRRHTESHYELARDHGFTDITDFLILDETDSISLPVTGGFHLSEDLVGAHFADFDGFLVLSHFKGHMMAGFGGALKNTSIGFASAAGKFLIHSAGTATDHWDDADTPLFLEAMADACQAVLAAQPNILFVNVLNNLSIDCDCDPEPAPPKMADIGILASRDPVAIDQAAVDLIYASDDDSADLIARMESLDGPHVLEAAEKLGIGSRAYELVELG